MWKKYLYLWILTFNQKHMVQNNELINMTINHLVSC
jgi:hypothetical protein